MVSFLRCTAASALLFLGLAGIAEADEYGGLPRKNAVPLEAIAGVETTYGSLAMPEGYRVRTIITKPQGATGRLPAILYVQWLSCDTVETVAANADGWTQVLRGLAQTPGFLFARTEKPGIGDSEGPACATLDYETEVSMHRRAFDALIERPDVDPDRVFIVGMSMGTTMAPLVASGRKVAGIAVWGGGARTWLERQLGFERRVLELSGADPAILRERMEKVAALYLAYLVKGQDPAEIAAAHPELTGVWDHLVGVTPSSHFGRPFAFHRQAEAQDWAGAWAAVDAPTLVLYGAYDFYESEESAQAIVNFVNRSGPPSATLMVFPQTDHHFMRYPSLQAAFAGKDGAVNADPVIAALRTFLIKNAGP